MKRPTDKERLDWLQKNVVTVTYCMGKGTLTTALHDWTLRQAIDAAMKSEKKSPA